MNLTKNEIEKIMRPENRTLKGWDSLCDEIKKNHGGKYPDDWYSVVVTGKLAPNTEISLTTMTK